MTRSSTAPVELTVTTSGSGRPVMVVHGGGGPASVASIVAHLSADHLVLAPTLPGWNGTPRPDWLTDLDDVALLLLDHLREQDLYDVAVVGSSVGGWIGSAMAVFDADAGRINRLVLVDAVGIDVPGEPMPDFFALDAHGIADLSFHDGDRFYVDPDTLTPEQQAAQQANLATLAVFAGSPYMHDPRLEHRLGRVTLPVLGIWGDSDQIATPAYGRAYLDKFPNGELQVVADAGHLPHIEQPAATFALLDAYLA